MPIGTFCQQDSTAPTKNPYAVYSINQGIVGDALAEKIVEMHESCVESALDAGDTAGSTTPASGSRGEAGGRRESGGASKPLASAATPKDYVSFLRSWFDMHESKKVKHPTTGLPYCF